MSRIEVIGRTHIRSWRKRWLELSSQRFANDYEVAALAAEIRKEFPKGDSGSLQFARFIRANLRGTNGLIMSRKATAHGLFTEEQWKNLGGWSGISFLSALTAGERSRVLATLKGTGPHHYSTIRNRALKLKIVSCRKGRDTRSKAEERVRLLQGWIVSLFRNKRLKKLLPPMPQQVRAALTEKTLVNLAGKANALAGRISA